MSEVKQYDAFDGYGTPLQGKFVRHADYAALEAECERLRDALETVEHEHELLRQMKNCEIRRTRGSFGIAVMSDPLAIEWQALDSGLQQLIDARRAALAAHRKQWGE